MGLLLLFTVVGSTARADSAFTIADPPQDFEVIDAEPFDGIGDNGPYSTFNDAVLGTVGEARSMAELDLSTFTVPPGEVIGAATFEVRLTSIYVFGLGVDGEIPHHLSVDGYVGNGLAELSDFQAGDGNALDSVATASPFVGQIVSFDVTSFVTELVDAGEPFVGLTVRAGSFGGLMMEEGGGFPRLTIETVIASAVPGSEDPSSAPVLRQNEPNPFSVRTRIGYVLPGDGERPVSLTVHDVTGRLVRTLEASPGPGSHSVTWDGTNRADEPVPAGVYFCRLLWNGKSETRRMLLVR